ncbi:MAG: tyrosine-type recombinase/integrase [Clostridia bacterium]|nr:tyrosine-type recombinase/integrase [Clostridia bacterium]
MIKKYKLKNTEKWMFNEYIGTDPITEKQVVLTRRGFNTKKQAEAALREIKYKFDKGKLKYTTSITYGEAYKMWLPLYKETVKGSSFARTKRDFELHILPVFENLPLSNITPAVCQRFANEIAPKFVRYRELYRKALRVYDYAYKVGFVQIENPFNRVIMPNKKQSKAKVIFLEKKELNLLLETFKKEKNYKWYAFFRLLAYTGIRRGEALALMWSDIDFKKKTISINKTISIDSDNCPCITSTKTSSSNRVIDVDIETLDILKDYARNNKILSIKGFVFPDRNGNFLSLSRPLHNLRKITDKYNFKKVTVHSFRHTHCSLLFDAGWDIKSVQERLGHSEIETTMDIYAHVTKEKKKKNMESFVKFMQAN